MTNKKRQARNRNLRTLGEQPKQKQLRKEPATGAEDRISLSACMDTTPRAALHFAAMPATPADDFFLNSRRQASTKLTLGMRLISALGLGSLGSLGSALALADELFFSRAASNGDDPFSCLFLLLSPS